MSFNRDPFPGRPRILFVGQVESSHARAWIDLLESAKLNVRLFAFPFGHPPDGWAIKTYVTRYSDIRNQKTRAYLNPVKFYWWAILRRFRGEKFGREMRWLANVLRSWKPHVVHTFGFQPASYLLSDVIDRFEITSIGKWVAQVRGGPDLALHRLTPEYRDNIKRVLLGCDFLITDNELNYEYAVEIGMDRAKIASLGAVPGTGGVDLAVLSSGWDGKPSTRKRLILWPKAYENPQEKALPVLEAFRMAWQHIEPCEVHMLWTTFETRMWFRTLPSYMQNSFKVSERIPRDEVLRIMRSARIMLAPSLSDGVPNVLYEAMALGAFPIVSPLETITPIVEHEENVLFARNLYPQEIADALTRAMSDNDLIDRAAINNLEIVNKHANRKVIRSRVIDFYESISRF